MQLSTTTTTTTPAQTLPIPPAAPPAAATSPAAKTAVNISPVDVGENIGDEAFATMTQSQLPMTPNQIRTLRKLFDETQRAAAEYPGVPPRPTSSSIVVNLAPGATPPVIRLLSGFVTSLVFVDATGAPWPIKAIDIGDPQAFDFQWDKKMTPIPY